MDCRSQLPPAICTFQSEVFRQLSNNLDQIRYLVDLFLIKSPSLLSPSCRPTIDALPPTLEPLLQVADFVSPMIFFSDLRGQWEPITLRSGVVMEHMQSGGVLKCGGIAFLGRRMTTNGQLRKFERSEGNENDLVVENLWSRLVASVESRWSHTWWYSVQAFWDSIDGWESLEKLPSEIGAWFLFVILTHHFHLDWCYQETL